MNHYAVILAGGRGERFWPLSTAKRPKQFLALAGEKTLLAQAVDRLEGLIPPDRVYIVTSRELIPAAREAAPAVPAANIIGEPVGRDTAAAVALAGGIVKARDPQAAFCVLTADHVIGNPSIFSGTLARSLELALGADVLVTIGIRPAGPSTAYGYIESGEALDVRDHVRFFRALRFVEKPAVETAREYIATGRYYWNSGMFLWSVAALERAFARHRPVLAGLLNRMAAAAKAGTLDAEMDAAYPALEKISIDYALMEKSDNIVMAAGEFPWDDVGSWTALANHFPADPAGNTVIGEARLHRSAGNIVFSRGHVTALVGVEDLVVVQAPGVTLVCAKDRAQEIKKLVETLRQDPAASHLV
jgi:mannose-1-phosphate guanylyltransferase